MSETKPSRADHGAYVRKVQEGAQNFTHDLLSEIERLHVLVAALEVEKETLADRTRDIQQALQANEALRALAASLEAEMNRLHEQVVALRGDNERFENEQARLQAQLETTRAESRSYVTRYAEIETQNSNLANLYVASYRLHGTLDRKEVIDTLQEIIANLIGSEEAGLFELDSERKSLKLVASFGLRSEAFRSVPVGSGRIGQAAETGEIFVAENGAAEDGLNACIPLKLDGRVFGAIAIFGLLPQKSGFEDVDRELFELLATHAATALYCTSLHKALLADGVAR
jgi:putative methionine-R-sulfoxide reductase with GAF domain